MPLSDVASIAITLAILGLAVVSAWRYGRLNPENTGRLGKEIGSLRGDFKKLEDRVGGCATTAALSLLASEVRSLEGATASSGEMNALEGKINALAEKIDAQVGGLKDSSDRTWEAVDRMQRFFIEEGLRSMGGNKS